MTSFTRIPSTRRTSLVGCLAAASLTFDYVQALPVLSPVSMSVSKVALTQTGATSTTASEASQTIAAAAPAAVAAPVVQAPLDPCHQKLSTVFSKENLDEDPADAVVSFIDDYCLEHASFLNSKSSCSC